MSDRRTLVLATNNRVKGSCQIVIIINFLHISSIISGVQVAGRTGLTRSTSPGTWLVMSAASSGARTGPTCVSCVARAGTI